MSSKKQEITMEDYNENNEVKSDADTKHQSFFNNIYSVYHDANTIHDVKKDEKFYNNFATKKSFASGLMDGALLATNAAQLRTLLSDEYLNGPKDPKWIISLVFVSVSIISQVIILVLLGVLANNNLANRAKKSYINVMNDIVLVLSGIIFTLNIITNVFIQTDFTEILNKTTTTVSATLPADLLFFSTTVPNIFNQIEN